MLCYIIMDLKPSFLNTTYAEQESRDMIKMLWERCFPKTFYEHIKKPENFMLLNSEKRTFKHAKNIVHSYVQLPDVCGGKCYVMLLNITAIINTYTHYCFLNIIYNITNTEYKAELSLLCALIIGGNKK